MCVCRGSGEEECQERCRGKEKTAYWDLFRFGLYVFQLQLLRIVDIPASYVCYWLNNNFSQHMFRKLCFFRFVPRLTYRTLWVSDETRYKRGWLLHNFSCQQSRSKCFASIFLQTGLIINICFSLSLHTMQ